MIYKFLGDFIIFLHLCWILFVILIFIKTLLSAFKKDYKFFKKVFLRTIHFAGIIFVGILIIIQKPCPLTILEVKLKMLANEEIYTGSFIIHYLEKLVYPDVNPLLVEIPSIVIAILTAFFYFKYPPFSLRKKIKYNVLIYFLFATSTLFAQEKIIENELTAILKSVELYPESAVIYREANLKLSKGEQLFFLKDLPAEIMNETLNVYKLENDAPFIIKNFDLKEIEARVILTDKSAKLKEKLEKLKDNLKKKENELHITDNKIKFYESISAKTSDEISKRLLLEQVNIKNLNEILKFINNGLEESLAYKSQLEKEIIDIKNEIKITESQLAEIEKEYLKKTKVLNILIYANDNIESRIGIRYTIFGKSKWLPYYEINYDSNKNRLNFFYYSIISQNTTEKWENIKLSLFTGLPLYNVTLPEVKPWIVEGRYKDEEIFIPRGKKSEELLELKTSIEEEPSKYEIVENISQEELNFKINLTGRFSIPNTLEEKKILIYQNDMTPISVNYNAYPSLNNFAYLTAEFENKNELTILPGEVSLFINNNYSGKASFLNPLRKNEKIKFSFGVDESIKVKKTVLHKIKGKSGILKGKKSIDYGAKIEIENYKNKEIELYVNEPLPFVQHKDIKFELYEKNIEPAKIDEQNIYIWKLNLKPKEKKEILYKFRIIYPEDMIIWGI